MNELETIGITFFVTDEIYRTWQTHKLGRFFPKQLDRAFLTNIRYQVLASVFLQCKKAVLIFCLK